VKLQKEFAAEYFRVPAARPGKERNYSDLFFFAPARDNPLFIFPRIDLGCFGS